MKLKRKSGEKDKDKSTAHKGSKINENIKQQNNKERDQTLNINIAITDMGKM